MELALQFSKIFAGLDRAHGWYAVAPAGVAGKKVKGKARTLQEPVTLEVWEKHLRGEEGLGIVPLRADHTVVFGAIDVDVYDLDLPSLVERIKAMELPLILCRTKSGGAHLYLFTRVPVPAELLRRKLQEWCRAFGYVNANGEVDIEIFPKQDRFEEDLATGNWINMPYFGGEDSLRYALAKRALTPEEFIQYWDKMAVADEESLAAITPKILFRQNQTGPAITAISEVPAEVAENLLEAPPCLHQLATNGFPEGSRNNGLFNIAVYAKKRFPEEQWKDKTEEYNNLYMQPPLSSSEAKVVIGSVARRSYGYKCKDQPIVACCDRKTCLKRDFGVGGGVRADEIGLGFGTMTKVLTKPVLWLWQINGELLEFDTKDLMSQSKFQEKILEMISLWPPAVRPKAWQEMIQSAVDNAIQYIVPEDATTSGQIWEQLQKYCTARHSSRQKDELLLGKPFTDEHRSYFVAGDFIAYLIQHRFPGRVNEREIYLILSERGLLHHHEILKGKHLSFWSVPAFKTQIVEHAVPHEEPKDAM